MNLHQLMVDHSPHMVMLVDPADLRILVANRKVEQTLGYAAAQLRDMLITDIESSLQDVFYWEEVRGGQYLGFEAQEGEYLCADTSLLTVMKSVDVLHDGDRPLLLVRAQDC